MSLFKQILTEIAADKAYEKYYSNMPRETFDKIVGGAKNIDKLIQFFLNCVRDGNAAPNDVLSVMNAYKKSDQLVKQEVQRKLDKGEYDFLNEMESDINFWNENGVVTPRMLAEYGFHKIFETENWIVTFTSTYEANSHYFGYTSWCTASDRLGRYDGYRMFKRYTDDYGDAILIQITNKEDKNNTFQAEIYKNDEGVVRYAMICNAKDRNINVNELKNQIGLDEFKKIENVLKNNLEEYVSEQNKASEKEKPYEDEKTNVLEIKREILRKRKQDKIDKVQDKVNKYNNAKIKHVSEVFESNKGMFGNVDFLNKAIEFYKLVSSFNEEDLDKNVDEYEKKLEEFNYASIERIKTFKKNKCALIIIAPSLGKRDYLNVEDYDDDSNMNVEEKFFFDVSTGAIIDHGGIIYICAINNNEKVTDILYTSGFIDNSQFGGFAVEKLISIYYNQKNILFDTESKKIIAKYDLENTHSFSSQSIRHDAEFFNYTFIFSDEIDNQTNIIIYDNDKIILSGKVLNFAYRDWNDIPTISFLYEENAFVFADAYVNGKGFSYKIKNENSNNITNIWQAFSLPVDKFLRVMYENGKENVFNVTKNEYVFGKSYMNLDSDDDIDFFVQLPKTNKYIYYIVNEDRYELRDYTKGPHSYEPKVEPCDKFGRTEKDMIAAKNFENWKAKGGHSPEVKAQMDKMWNDREDNSEHNAFTDWNDDDRNLDDSYCTYDNGAFSTALQKFDKRDDWRGHIDFKDPMGYESAIDKYLNSGDFNANARKLLNGEIPDYVRRNPWYRIDKRGKAIDQPWYDEDEIPAKPSDRVGSKEQMKEELKKIMNKLFD